jgi:hypothetical protein
MEATKQEAGMDNQNQGSNQTVKVYLTVKDFAKKHRVFSENSLRWMIFNRSTNGFDSCFRKVGKKRVVIDEAAFFEKIDSSAMGA